MFNMDPPRNLMKKNNHKKLQWESNACKTWELKTKPFFIRVVLTTILLHVACQNRKKYCTWFARERTSFRNPEFFGDDVHSHNHQWRNPCLFSCFFYIMSSEPHLPKSDLLNSTSVRRSLEISLSLFLSSARHVLCPPDPVWPRSHTLPQNHADVTAEFCVTIPYRSIVLKSRSVLDHLDWFA